MGLADTAHLDTRKVATIKRPSKKKPKDKPKRPLSAYSKLTVDLKSSSQRFCRIKQSLSFATHFAPFTSTYLSPTYPAITSNATNRLLLQRRKAEDLENCLTERW